MTKAVILGATGLIGQQFARLLINHPQIELSEIYASQRSAGESYEKSWNLPFFQCPTELENKEIRDIENLNRDFDIAFSALPSSVATELEVSLREDGIAVFSNAGAHRMDADVPILIPEINASHIELAKIQQERVGNNGFIITNSNCSAAGASVYLGELDKLVDIDKTVITTYQALSGAGSDGVSALDITGNVIPYISNEEPKIIAETKKILGTFSDGKIESHPMQLVSNAARVDVIDGHLESVTTFTESGGYTQKDLRQAFRELESPLATDDLHIAPNHHITYMDQEDRPQPSRDVFSGDDKSSGMEVPVGRLRANEFSISTYLLVHNTIRGGAGGSVLNAEFAIQQGLI